jgi:hypothetical protein
MAPRLGTPWQLRRRVVFHIEAQRRTRPPKGIFAGFSYGGQQYPDLDTEVTPSLARWAYPRRRAVGWFSGCAAPKVQPTGSF